MRPSPLQSIKIERRRLYQSRGIEEIQTEVPATNLPISTTVITTPLLRLPFVMIGDTTVSPAIAAFYAPISATLVATNSTTSMATVTLDQSTRKGNLMVFNSIHK
jgi:hypothetical protein